MSRPAVGLGAARAVTTAARRDEGASLVLVMVFVMVTGLVVGSLLTFAGTGISSAAQTRDRHVLASDAAGAMDVAINALRQSSYADPAQSCPVDGMVVDGSAGDVTIDCSPEPGSGVSAGVVPITSLNRPGSAVLTLGTSGTGLEKASNGVLRIKGRVVVNTNIDVPSANSLVEVDQAPVLARTGCTPGKVTSTVSVDCAMTGTPPESKDPATLTDADMPGGSAIAAGYAQPPSGPADLVHRIVPTSCPAGAVVQMQPGYYDDAVALTAMTNSCAKPVHFTPGVYYFDFRNEEMGALPAAARPMSSGTNRWSINNSNAAFYLVGGTPQAWSATGPTTFPGSCVTPLTTTLDNRGVQFVFGGSSRMEVLAGKVELCGQYSVDRPALVVYGARAGATVTVPARTLPATTATSPVAAPEVPFTAPDRARVRDGSLATAAVVRSATAVTSTTLRLGGLAVADRVPAGSVLLSAELRVTHRETTVRSQDALSVSVTPNPARSGTPAPVVATAAPPVNGTALLRTDTVPLMNAALAQEVWRYGLQDLRIDYGVQVARTGNGMTALGAELDALELVLSWRPPSLRGQTQAVNGSNCVGGVDGTCPLIFTDGAQTQLYLQGTTYTPLAALDVRLTNVSGQVFKSGVVARSLAISVTPSAGFTGPVIEIPDETGAGVEMDVYLTAYVCRTTCGAPPPSAGWRRVGRSSVSLESAYPVPSTGQRGVTVTSWHLLE